MQGDMTCKFRSHLRNCHVDTRHPARSCSTPDDKKKIEKQNLVHWPSRGHYGAYSEKKNKKSGTFSKVVHLLYRRHSGGCFWEKKKIEKKVSALTIQIESRSGEYCWEKMPQITTTKEEDTHTHTHTHTHPSGHIVQGTGHTHTNTHTHTPPGA